MIDSKQDEAVKLEAARAQALEEAARLAETWRDENRAAAAKARKSNNGEADRLDGAAVECNALAAEIRKLSTLPPANLNAPDKQEALAEGVEPDVRRRLLSVCDTLETAGGQAFPINFHSLAADIRAALSRTPSSPQADEADVERVARSLAQYSARNINNADAWIERNWQAYRPEARAVLSALSLTRPEPIPMLLFCPTCGTKHVDEPEPGMVRKDLDDKPWTNPPHRSHLCHACYTIWRPADVPTNGVASIETTGKADTIDLNELPSLTSPAGGEEVGWTIEHGPADEPVYLTASMGWSKHRASAIRFARKADADDMIEANGWENFRVAALTKPAALPKEREEAIRARAFEEALAALEAKRKNEGTFSAAAVIGECQATIRALTSLPVRSGEVADDEQMRALLFALTLVTKHANEAMHVRKATRDVVEGIESVERTLKAMIAALAPPPQAHVE